MTNKKIATEATNLEGLKRDAHERKSLLDKLSKEKADLSKAYEEKYDFRKLVQWMIILFYFLFWLPTFLNILLLLCVYVQVQTT